MENVQLLKNPVLRNKVNASLDNPSGNVLEEISSQDMGAQAGGTITSILYPVASWYLGNKGYVCTATKECMPSCN